jgi:hypothetical protein
MRPEAVDVKRMNCRQSKTGSYGFSYSEPEAGVLKKLSLAGLAKLSRIID